MKLKTEELAGPRALGTAKMRAEELNTLLALLRIRVKYKCKDPELFVSYTYAPVYAQLPSGWNISFVFTHTHTQYANVISVLKFRMNSDSAVRFVLVLLECVLATR